MTGEVWCTPVVHDWSDGFELCISGSSEPSDSGLPSKCPKNGQSSSARRSRWGESNPYRFSIKLSLAGCERGPLRVVILQESRRNGTSVGCLRAGDWHDYRSRGSIPPANSPPRKKGAGLRPG